MTLFTIFIEHLFGILFEAEINIWI